MHVVRETRPGTRERVHCWEARDAWPEVATKTAAKRQVRVIVGH